MPRAEMEPGVRRPLLETMLRELDKKGREGISLNAVLAAAEVSQEEFAAEYAGVDECLGAAYDELSARIAAAVRAGCRTGGEGPFANGRDWPSQVWGGLEALLAELAGDPPLARALVRTFPSLGPEAQRRYQAFVQGFAPMLGRGRELSAVAEELPASVETLAVGAAEAIVFEEVATGRTEQLPTLGPSILFSVLVPFLGPGAAAVEMEKAQQRP